MTADRLKELLYLAQGAKCFACHKPLPLDKLLGFVGDTPALTWFCSRRCLARKTWRD